MLRFCEKARSKNIKKLVIFLHGYGSSSEDLIQLSDLISPEDTEISFIAPDAPFEHEYGSGGFQWYSLLDRTPEVLLNESRVAEKILGEFIDQQLERLSLQEENLYLIGFSQGSMIGMHTALRRKKACAGIVAASGTLLSPDILHKEITSRPKICIIHGDEDNVVPISLGKISYKYLLENNVDTEFHKINGLGHSINQEGIRIMNDFILK